MSCCARCGECICATAGKIALNKVWHRGCFRCYNCNRPLAVNSAKIFYGEVYCSCCCPKIEECPSPCSPPCSRPCSPMCSPVCSPGCPPGCSPRCTPGCSPPFPTVCSMASNTNCNQECCEIRMNPICCPMESDTLRDVHSCSCIPSCCTDTPCRPRSPKPLNYPPRCRPRSPSPCCPTPKKPQCCYVKMSKNCGCEPPGCSMMCKKKYCLMEPGCPRTRRCCYNPCALSERCRRCGEKVFAAEKVLSSCGAFHLGCFTCCCCCKPLCVKSMCEASGEIFCKQCYNNYFGIGGYGFTTC